MRRHLYSVLYAHAEEQTNPPVHRRSTIDCAIELDRGVFMTPADCDYNQPFDQIA